MDTTVVIQTKISAQFKTKAEISSVFTVVTKITPVFDKLKVAIGGELS
jgi:hypothetical protein